MGAVHNCEDGADRHKTKHLDIKYLFIREAVRKGLVKIRHIGTDHMVADIFTKGLRRQTFERCRKELGLMKGSVWEDVIKPRINLGKPRVCSSESKMKLGEPHELD